MNSCSVFARSTSHFTHTPPFPQPQISKTLTTQSKYNPHHQPITTLQPSNPLSYPISFNHLIYLQNHHHKTQKSNTKQHQFSILNKKRHWKTASSTIPYLTPIPSLKPALKNPLKPPIHKLKIHHFSHTTQHLSPIPISKLCIVATISQPYFPLIPQCKQTI